MTTLPANVPVPVDDGSCDHLTGASLPAVTLPATDGRSVNLAALTGTIVLYCYPRTGRPDTASPDGWSQIPGALGCTPQACSFRDFHGEIQRLGAQVFGISTQETAYQREAVDRLGLTFAMLSDQYLELAHALALPLFTAEGVTLNRRVTLIAREGVIVKVFYPVFPPDDHVEEVVAWLNAHTD